MKASVFVVTYNQEKYIRQCLDSILTQQVNFDYEVVIGEDHGTDHTRAICEEYAAKYPRIRLLPLMENVGVVKNWIRTIESCSGEYIALCEGDDYWTYSSKLQEQIDFLDRNPQCPLVYGTCELLYDENGKKKPKSEKDHKEGYVLPYMLGNNFVVPLTAMFRKDLVLDSIKIMKEYLPEKYWKSADYPLFLYLSKLGDFGYIPHSYGVYRISYTSISNTTDKQKNADFRTAMLEISNIYQRKINNDGIVLSKEQEVYVNKKIIYRRLALCDLYREIHDKKSFYREFIKTINYVTDMADIKTLVKYYIYSLCGKKTIY